MDFNAIALALSACAESVGLNALDYVPDTLPNTAFYVGEMEIDPNKTFGRRSGTRQGTDQAVITCRVLVARSTDKSALRKSREYMGGSGARSLIQAIQTDATLGGTCHASKVERVSGNRMFDVAGLKYYGVEIDVFVIGAA